MTRRASLPFAIAALALAAVCAWSFATRADAASTRTAVLVADPVRHAVVFVDPATGAQGDLATGAALGTPADVEISGGSVYVADRGGSTTGGILRLDPLTGAAAVAAAGAPLNHPQALETGSGGKLLTVQGNKTTAAVLT